MDGKNRFFAWLSKRTVREERSKIYVALSDLNSYCLRQGILTESLFDTHNMKIALKIRNMIGFDSDFRNIYRGKTSSMASSIQYYIYYLQDIEREEEARISEEAKYSAIETAPAAELTQEATPTEESIQEATPTEEPIQEAVPEQAHKTSVQNETSDNHSVKDAYLSWLSSQIPPEMTRDYQNAYKIINDYFLMSQYDILEIPDLSVLDMIRTEIAMNEEFRSRNQKQLRYIISAIKTYTQYVQYYVKKSDDGGFIVPEAETSPAVAPTVPEAETSPAVAPTTPEAETSLAVAPTMPEIETPPAVAPTMPEIETPPAVAPTVPEAETSPAVGDNSGANPDSNPNLYRIQFVDWMNANGYCKMLFDWPPLLVKWGQFANEQKITRKRIFQIIDPAQMDRMISALQNDQEFRIADEKSGFAISMALRCYREFCADMLSRKKQTETLPTPRSTPQIKQNPPQIQPETPQTEQTLTQKPVDPSQTEDERLKTVLKEYSDGVILNALGLKKFRAKYMEQYGEAPSGDLDALKAKLNRIGILVDGRIHAKPDTDGVLSAITQAIDDAFQSGVSCVYLECVQARYQRELAEQARIYNSNALETVLKPVLNPQYAIFDGLIRRRGHVVSVESDVLRVFKNQNLPLSYADLRKILWYIPLTKIKQELAKEPSIVSVDAETYFYAPNLPVSRTELDIISNAMRQELDRKGFLVAKDIPAIMRQSCPAAAVNTESFKDWGLRNIFAYLLRDRFSFAGRIIGPYGKPVDTPEVYRRYCASYDRLTLDELKEFSAETDAGIPWNAVLESMIRVSPTELLNRNRIHFDAAVTDSVLDRLCPGDYLPIHAVELFMQFPDIGIPWNGFVLESYLLSDSKKFRLYQVSGISTANYYGVMVRADAPYNSYRDVIVDMLACSERWRNADEAWRLILDQGCQARRSPSGMDAIMRDARAKRARMNQVR